MISETKTIIKQRNEIRTQRGQRKELRKETNKNKKNGYQSESYIISKKI